MYTGRVKTEKKELGEINQRKTTWAENHRSILNLGSGRVHGDTCAEIGVMKTTILLHRDDDNSKSDDNLTSSRRRQ